MENNDSNVFLLSSLCEFSLNYVSINLLNLFLSFNKIVKFVNIDPDHQNFYLP